MDDDGFVRHGRPDPVVVQHLGVWVIKVMKWRQCGVSVACVLIRERKRRKGVAEVLEEKMKSEGRIGLYIIYNKRE